jgi:hypothetical protein
MPRRVEAPAHAAASHAQEQERVQASPVPELKLNVPALLRGGVLAGGYASRSRGRKSVHERSSLRGFGPPSY